MSDTFNFPKKETARSPITRWLAVNNIPTQYSKLSKYSLKLRLTAKSLIKQSGQTNATPQQNTLWWCNGPQYRYDRKHSLIAQEVQILTSRLEKSPTMLQPMKCNRAAKRSIGKKVKIISHPLRRKLCWFKYAEQNEIWTGAPPFKPLYKNPLLIEYNPPLYIRWNQLSQRKGGSEKLMCRQTNGESGLTNGRALYLDQWQRQNFTQKTISDKGWSVPQYGLLPSR